MRALIAGDADRPPDADLSTDPPCLFTPRSLASFAPLIDLSSRYTLTGGVGHRLIDTETNSSARRREAVGLGRRNGLESAQRSGRHGEDIDRRRLAFE